MSELNNFIQIVDDIYGIYLDSTTGFFAIRKNLINTQLSVSKELSLSIEDLDKRRYLYGKGDPNKKGSYSLHDCTQGGFKKRNKEDGTNCIIISGICMVIIYQYWEDYFRKKIADEEGVGKNDIEWDIMGDIRLIRDSIIHHRGIAISEIEECKILKFFKKNKAIEINSHQFEEIIKKIKDSKYEIRAAN